MRESLKYWWMILIKGIILVLLSFFIFRHPVSALLGLTIYIGISLMVSGFLLVFSSVSVRKMEENWGWQLAEGVVDVIFAFIMLSNPAITAAVFPFVVGFWMMVYGVILFAGSFKVKKDGDKSWWMNLVGGILTVVIGYFITVDLLAGTIAITFWLGTGVLIFGIVNISAGLRMRKLQAAG